MDLNPLLTQMIERKASDLHLVAGVPPIFRVDGELVPASPPNLTSEDLDALLQFSLPAKNLDAAREGRDFSATLRHEDQTFRCLVFRDRGHPAAAIRILPKRIPTLDEMHLPPIFETLTHLRRGLVLIVGPTGSGKTTTVFSMLEHINLTRSERIYTLESPLNYVLPSKLSLVTQQVVGDDVESCEIGLRTLRDADPDVVFVAELRTAETVRLAAELAEAGVLVFAQMTADTAAEATRCLIDILDEPRDVACRLVARTLQAVIAQRLLTRQDRQGRVAASEILVFNTRLRQIIADGQGAPNLLEGVMETSHAIGMQTMDDALMNYYADGVISRETAEMHLKDKGRLGHGVY